MINLEALCKEVGLVFYDAQLVSENNHQIYRISVCKEKDGKFTSVSLDECQKLSEILSPIFDTNPPVNTEYFLEISSLGLERKLSKLRHFELSIAELVKITLQNNEKVQGKILSVENDEITLEDESKKKIKIKFDEIKKAKTFVIW